MFEELIITPRRHILTETSARRHSKVSTIAHSRQSSTRKDSIHWEGHETRRENRMTSLLKMRKGKLEEITDQNRRIFQRINQQQSNYARQAPKCREERSRDKENTALGPIGQWQTPSYFMNGDRAIMCDKGLLSTHKNTIQWGQGSSKLPLIEPKSPLKENNGPKRTMQKQGHYTSARKQRSIPDIYLMI